MTIKQYVAPVIINVCYFFTIAGVVIGFEETEVQIPENITDGIKLLCAKVLDGELICEATVIVQYYNHTAVGKYVKYNIIINLS